MDTPEADDSLTQRRPSTSTSTRLAPRWRRSTVVEPAPTPPPSGGKPKLPDELNLVLRPEPDAVICCNTSPIEVKPARSMSARVMTCTGDNPSSSAFLMREPVTSTRSRVLALSCGASCASATSGNAPNNSALLTAALSRLRRNRFMRIYLLDNDGWVTGRLCSSRADHLCKENVKRAQEPVVIIRIAMQHSDA